MAYAYISGNKQIYKKWVSFQVELLDLVQWPIQYQVNRADAYCDCKDEVWL